MDSFISDLQGSFAILRNPDVLLYLLKGLAFTLGISVITILCSIMLGAVLALMRNYCTHGTQRILKGFATCYIELFRNTPLMLWIFVCFILCPAPAFSKSFATTRASHPLSQSKHCSKPLLHSRCSPPPSWRKSSVAD